MYQGREERSYDNEVPVWDLSLQNSPAVRERKTVVRGTVAHPGEQQMRHGGHTQQESHRDVSTSPTDPAFSVQ